MIGRTGAIDLDDLIARTIARLVPPRVMRNIRFFHLWEQRGYHVTPVHFYQPIPDTRQLNDEVWARCSSLTGIDLNEAGQLELLAEFERRYRTEYDQLPDTPTAVPHQFHLGQHMFHGVDAEILYAMVRHRRPKRVIEIGSGFSTYLAAQAIRANEQEGAPCRLVTIEPHPNDVLRGGFPGLAGLIDKPAQHVPLSEFETLGPGDILFIDSSHVLAIGSDVQYIYLEILPRLSRGVAVHLHDIFLPAEYPRDWVMAKGRFWNEQYLLAAFLTFNERFKVLWSSFDMHLRHPDRLKQAFRSYRTKPGLPVSFWIERTQ